MVPVPQETVAVAMFQWKRLPITKKIVLRYAALFGVIVIACTFLGYAASAMSPAKYGARSEITFPIPANMTSGDFMRQDRTLQTQLVAMKSQATLQPVADQYKMTVKQLSKKVTATVLEDSLVIRVEVDDTSRARAKDLVGAILSVYFKNQGSDVNTLTEKSLTGQIKDLSAQRTELSTRLNTQEAARLAANPNSTPTAGELQLQSQLDDLQTQIAALQTQLSQVTITQIQTPRAKYLTVPYSMDGKVAPKPIQGAIAGFLAGIMIGIIVIGLLVRRLLKREPEPA